MIFKPKNDKINFLAPTERNDLSDKALYEAGERLNKAGFNSPTPSADFAHELKAKIMQKRHKKFGMENIMDSLASFFRPKRLASAGILALVVLIVLSTFYMWPVANPEGLLQGRFAELSRLIISPAYAEDNFEVQATSSDSLGVESDTAFIIKSKDKLDPDLLKEYIVLTPETDFDFKKISDYEFKVEPKGDLQGRRVYNLKIAAAYVNEHGVTVARDFSWAFQVKDTFKVINSIPRHQATEVPLDSGIEITFSHDNFENFAQAITITPSLEGKFEVHKRTVVFVPKAMRAGTVYKVTVNKDLLTVKGSDKRLSENYVFEFETVSTGQLYRDYSRYSSVTLSDYLNEFAVGQEPFFGVYRYNSTLADLPLSVYSFSTADQFLSALKEKDNLPYWASFTTENYKYDVSRLSKVADYTLPVQKLEYSEYLVLPEGLPAGFYLAEMTVGDKTSQVFFQVNNLAVYTSVNTDRTLVWVNDIGTGAKVSGAKVNVVDKQAEARTDKDGVAILSSDDFFDADSDPYSLSAYLKVESGSSVAVSYLRPQWIYFAKESGQQFNAEDYWFYFYKDRSTYQPTDTVNLWGFVKHRDGGKLPAGISVRLVDNNYFNYYYEHITVAEADLEMVGDYAFKGSLPLANLTPGYYSLEYRLGEEVISTGYLQVETYVKPAYNFTATANKNAIFAGDEFSVKFKTSFFEGTPVPGIDLTSHFSYSKSGEQAEAKTNELGEAVVTYQTTYKDCGFNQDGSCGYPMHVSVDAEAKYGEAGDISAYDSITIFGAQVATKVDFKQLSENRASILTEAKQINLDAYNLDNKNYYEEVDREPATNRSLRAEVTEISYNKVETGEYYDFINKVVRKTYRYDRVEKKVAEYTGTTDSNGEHLYEMNIDLNNSYKVRVMVDDGAGRNDLTYDYLYTRKNNSNNYDYDYYSLDFVNHGESAEPMFNSGDRVEIEFLNNGDLLPSSKGQFLFYKTQRGLVDYALETKPNYAFNFSEDYIPNVYVHGVWFDGRSYKVANANGWNPWSHYSSGLAVRMDTEDRELKVGFEFDKDRYAPGEEVTIVAKVTDKDDRPVRANLNLNLIDEAYYKISDDRINIIPELFRVVSSGQITENYTHKSADFGLDSSGAEMGGCFLAGTQIKMADDTLKNIEDIVPGDQIYTFESEVNHKLVKAKVVEVFEHVVPEYWIINDRLKVTPEHRVFVNGGWQMIGEAKVGDHLTDENGNSVVINTIERSRETVKVFNFHVEKYHTYIADGIYVHNEKGGPRQVFVDNALFEALETGSDGRARVTFTLPDNITSWRVNGQAISNDIMAGFDTSQLMVSLPVFVDATLASEYVLADKPVVKVRAYGEELKTGDKVKFTLHAEGMGMKADSKNGQAYVAEYFPLSGLKLGEHAVDITLEKDNFQDRLIKKIKVVNSRVRQGTKKFYTLSPELKVDGASDNRTRLIFSDQNQGRYYDMLRSLGWSWGDRVDQKLARVLSRDFGRHYFGDEEWYSEDIKAELYQLPSGGISLLTYGSEDFELSAKVAAIAGNYFDTSNLANYFYGILNDNNSTQEQVGIALYGLAGLGEPVLPQVQAYARLESLTAKEKLYVALSAQELGDSELARNIYNQVMRDNGEEIDNQIRLNIGDKDDILTHTSLAAVLAVGFGDARHEKLWSFVESNGTEEVLIELEKAMYLDQALPKFRPGPVSFKITLNGKTTEHKLEKGQSFVLSVTPEERANITFSEINGQVGVVSYYEMPVASGESYRDLSLKREYFVDDKKTNEFKENDLIQIKLTPALGQSAVDGAYQLTDLLPSGLALVTNMYRRGQDYDCSYRYPYEVNGQTIKFMIYPDYKSYCGDTITYYARVVNPGEYEAEAALLQSQKVPTVRAYSLTDRVKINY